jgi:hypothetical protein
MHKHALDRPEVWSFEFEIWNLFAIWDLVLGASIFGRLKEGA